MTEPRTIMIRDMRPRVSVVIPAYNHEKYVGKAVESVLGQSFEDLELIIIDDGSTDATLREIKKYEDPRVRIYAQENMGAAATINKGIRFSRGDFISILNSDDVYHHHRLARLVSFMDENPECAIAFTLVRPIDQEGRPVQPNGEHGLWCKWYDKALACFEKEKDPLSSLLRQNFVVTTSNIFGRREVFDNGELFNEHLAYCHDYEFLLRIAKKYKVDMIKEKLLSYRLHPLNTIKEHEFLKHLEVLFSIFSVIDVKRLLEKRDLDGRTSDPLFRSLVENPEINYDKYATEYLAIISEKDRALKEITQLVHTLNEELGRKQNQLKEADQWLKKLSREIEARYKDIEEKNKALLEARSRENKLRQELAGAVGTLQDIYNSRGWKWLTRYGRMKQKAIGLIRGFFTAGSTRLKLYRSLKDRIIARPNPSSCAETSEVCSDPITQRIEIRYPLEKNRPMVIHAIANFMTGGSSRLVADLVEHIGHRYRQEVMTFYVPTPPAFSGFPVHEFPRSAEKMSAFLRKKGAKILHVHYWGDCDEPWYREVFKAVKGLGCSVIENVNTPVETYVDDVIDYYVYVSHYARNYSTVSPEPAMVIYPGSDLNMFSRSGAPIPDNVIGMVYRLEKDKLREDSIQVFIEVVKRRPQTKAIIVGGGAFLEAYKRQTEVMGVARSFEFTGYVPYGQLPEYYRRFSIFVAPVWKESFGQVTPFAMGMGIPVTGYKVGALPEILGGDTYLGSNTRELAEIIIDLLDNREERLIVGHKNRERALKYFSLEAMVQQYESLYDKLLKRKIAQE